MVQERLIASWQDFQILAEQLDLGGPFSVSYVYRGLEDASWTLTPTLHRTASLDGRRALPGVAQLQSVERAVINRFRARAPALLPPAVLDSTNSVLDWWMVMRHYGVPTRLLDWTASIYVAAYFAACGSPQADGAIILLHAASMDAAMKAAHPAFVQVGPIVFDTESQVGDAPPILYLFERQKAVPERMVTQQGLFIACRNVAGDPETILTAEMPKVTGPSGTAFLKLKVPAALKPTFMRRLRAMNVTASTLFPGLDGIGRDLDHLVRQT